MTIAAGTPLLLLLLASLAIAGAGCGSSVQPSGGAATRTSGGSALAQTQNWGGDVERGVCPHATRNRSLPPRSGCVTVLRADLAGDGRDLILLYSRVSHERAAQIGLTGRIRPCAAGSGGTPGALPVDGDGRYAGRLGGSSAADLVMRGAVGQ